MSRDLIERLQHCIVSEAPGSWRKETMREAADRIIELEAEIEEMTPKFVAYDYLVSPAGEEMALEENARLRARMEEWDRRGLERAAVDRTAAIESFRRWYFNHTGKRIYYNNAGVAVNVVPDAALIPEAPAREGWQPIETAPKDGSRFLAKEGDRHFDCWWHWFGADEVHNWQDDADSEPNPTHWMPLPPPPSQDREPDSQRGAK